MTFRATLSCDAPDCTAVLTGGGHPEGFRRRAAEKKGWVCVRERRDFLDYCPDHRGYDPALARRRAAERETEENILNAAMRGAL